MNIAASGADVYLTLLDPFGNILTDITQFFSLHYVRSQNAPGALTLTLPRDFDLSLIRKHGRFAVYRDVPGTNGAYLDTETTWIIDGLTDSVDALAVLATTPVGMFGSPGGRVGPIVAYDSESAQTDKSQAADDMMKAVIRENLGTLATDTDRDLSSILTVAADLARGVTVSKQFSRRNVLRTLQEIVEKTRLAGSPVHFDVVAPTLSTLEFRTYINFRGNDLTNDMVFVEGDNITDVVFSDDWSEEVTFAYAGGRGLGAARDIGTASDTARIASSPWGRSREVFTSHTHIDATQADLDDAAASAVFAGRPQTIVTGVIQNAPGSLYGLDWFWGDRVKIETRRGIFTTDIDVVEARTNEDDETIRATFRVVL